MLIMHMLKTRYQPETQTRSWGLTMRIQRNHIAEFLKESPSLRRELPEQIAIAYGTALQGDGRDRPGIRCVSGIM